MQVPLSIECSRSHSPIIRKMQGPFIASRSMRKIRMADTQVIKLSLGELRERTGRSCRISPTMTPDLSLAQLPTCVGPLGIPSRKTDKSDVAWCGQHRRLIDHCADASFDCGSRSLRKMRDPYSYAACVRECFQVGSLGLALNESVVLEIRPTSVLRWSDKGAVFGMC